MMLGGLRRGGLPRGLLLPYSYSKPLLPTGRRQKVTWHSKSLETNGQLRSLANIRLKGEIGKVRLSNRRNQEDVGNHLSFSRTDAEGDRWFTGVSVTEDGK